MTKKEQQPIYVSPKVKTVEMKAQAIICQSGNRSMNEEFWGDGGFTEQE